MVSLKISQRKHLNVANIDALKYPSDTLQWLVLAAGFGHDTVGTRGHNEALATVTPDPRYTVTPDPHYTYHLAQGPHSVYCLGSALVTMWGHAATHRAT